VSPCASTLLCSFVSGGGFVASDTEKRKKRRTSFYEDEETLWMPVAEFESFKERLKSDEALNAADIAGWKASESAPAGEGSSLPVTCAVIAAAIAAAEQGEG
jgi:hypothetical protein